MRDRKPFPFLGRKHPASRGNLQIDRDQRLCVESDVSKHLEGGGSAR